MGFNFKLQKLLEYREDQKKMAQEELARKLKEHQSAQTELEQIQTAQQRLVEFHREQQGQAQGLDVYTLLYIDTYHNQLEKDLIHSSQKLYHSKKKMDSQRKVVVEHWQKCRMLEKLKEKALSEYNEDERLREQRVNDEFSLYSYLRQSADEPCQGGDETD